MLPLSTEYLTGPSREGSDDFFSATLIVKVMINYVIIDRDSFLHTSCYNTSCFVNPRVLINTVRRRFRVSGH
jgi:hypothetical protein